MRYPFKVKEQARKLWIQGTSYREIIKMPGMPHNLYTLWKWAQEGNWDEERQRLQQEAKKKIDAQIVDEISQMNMAHLTQLRGLQQHIAKLLTNPQLKPAEVRLLSSSLSDVIRNERLIRGVATEKQEVSQEITWKEIIFKAAELENETEKANGIKGNLEKVFTEV